MVAENWSPCTRNPPPLPPGLLSFTLATSNAGSASGGIILGGGSNEGLFGVTYEVVGSPGQPVLRINPISAILPGVTRKIMDFNTGKQNNQVEFPPSH